MRACEESLLTQLNQKFPTKVVFSDQSRLSDYLAIFAEVRKYARAEGLSSEEWLASQGFIWKITGYVEPDMCSRAVNELPEEYGAFELADYVFRKYPLAGEYQLNNREDSILYQSASKTVQKMLSGQGRPTARENVVLVLETINLLKNWSSELADDNSGSLWNYIFLQYGFNPEKSEAAANKLCNHFRAAIKETLSRYKRFFAPEGTLRYYTSLLLHALAPKQSIETLYTILFDFYVKNLDFQYVTEDISYKMFTRGMRARWDSRIAQKEDLQLKSGAIFSGLQALFKGRPGYMASLCDSIVKKMDALLRGETNELLDLERNYWDIILLEWYQRKSSVERAQAQGERRQRKAEYIATSADRIYAQYVMENASIGIAVPKIRLSKVDVQRPLIRVYQGDNCIFDTELSVTGNDLCLTTKSFFVPFDKTAYDFSGYPSVRVEISYAGKPLYDSAQKLYRQYILLDESGSERTARRGTVYLFAGTSQEVSLPDDVDGIYSCPHPGQLYRINLDEVSAIAIDGREVFASGATASQFRHHTSVGRVSACHALLQGTSADIFSKPFKIFVVFPQNEKKIRYQLSIDGVRHGIDEFAQNENELELVSINDSSCHCIRVIDITTGFIKYEFNYIVLADFRLDFDAPLYYAGVDQVTADVSFSDHQFNFLLMLEGGGDSAIVSIPGTIWQLELTMPVAHCTFMGHNAFTTPPIVWCKSIPGDEFVQLDLPNGWEGQLMLDVTPVPEVRSGCFELGNKLRAMSQPPPCSDLWISLKSADGGRLHRKITSIAFKPTFSAAPLEVVGDELLWQSELNYIGDGGSTFRIEAHSPDGIITAYHAGAENCTLVETASLPTGNHSYQVFLKKKSLFSGGTDELIFSGAYCIGNPHEWIYEGKELILGNALYWDFEKDALSALSMKPERGILAKLSYQGVSVASGETTAVPCYSGTLFFRDSTGCYIPFNSRAVKEFELVNPVKIWIVNDHLLILHCATDDAVYVDKRSSTIVNRSPSTYMSKAEQHQRLETPDYFEYTIREDCRYV